MKTHALELVEFLKDKAKQGKVHKKPGMDLKSHTKKRDELVINFVGKLHAGI